MNTESLGDRIKSMYEDRCRLLLPRRVYTIVRLDGKGFSNYTRKLTKPFDADLAEDFDYVTRALCTEIMGCKLAYTQSDEITLVLTDFDSQNADAWFGGNLQKIVSVAASMATAHFNKARLARSNGFRVAYFDARAFSVADREDVVNCLIWRQSDAVRNSVSGIARTAFSHKEMDGVGIRELRTKLKDLGIDLQSYPQGFLNGRVTVKELYQTEATNPLDNTIGSVTRSRWVTMPAHTFSENNIPLDWVPARPPFSRNHTD